MKTATPPPEPKATSLFDARYRVTTLAILTVVAMSAFEGLAVVAALPQVASSLGSVGLLPWVITSYLLTSGVATVAAGSLVDQHGVSRVFRGAVIVFVVGSVLSGLAPTMEVLIAARALQGIGAGAVNAVGLTAVGLVFPRHLVSRAFAANSNVWGIMGVAGPAIAAVLLIVASWRWIFLVNVPIGMTALWFGWSAMPGPRPGAVTRRLPVVDLSALALFTGLILWAVDALNLQSIIAGAGALLVGGALLVRNREREGALITPQHALSAPLGALAWAVTLLITGGIGVQTFMPLYISGALGVDAATTAWSVVFFVLGWTSGANLGARLAERWGGFRVVQLGSILPPIALAGVGAVLALDGGLVLLFSLMFIAGLGVGACTNSALSLLRTLVEDDDLGRAVAAHQFLRNLGFAMGNALMGAVLLGFVARETGDIERVREVIGGGSGVVGDAAVATAIAHGYMWAAFTAAGVTFLAQVPLWAVRRQLRRIDSAPS